MKELPYIVSTIKANHDAELWCLDSIGPKWGVFTLSGTWTCLWRGPERQYQWSFKNEQDAILFSLIWT